MASGRFAARSRVKAAISWMRTRRSLTIITTLSLSLSRGPSSLCPGDQIVSRHRSSIVRLRIRFTRYRGYTAAQEPLSSSPASRLSSFLLPFAVRKSSPAFSDEYNGQSIVITANYSWKEVAAILVCQGNANRWRSNGRWKKGGGGKKFWNSVASSRRRGRRSRLSRRLYPTKIVDGRAVRGGSSPYSHENYIAEVKCRTREGGASFRKLAGRRKRRSNELR